MSRNDHFSQKILRARSLLVPCSAASLALAVACSAGDGAGANRSDADTAGAVPGGAGSTNGTETMAGPTVVLAPGEASPGRVTAHRLNALEYDNTIRDLLSLDLGLSKTLDFPADEWGDGFDNDADVLTVSPLSVEKYLAAAQTAVSEALAPENAAARARVLTCDPTGADPANCVTAILSDFGGRAFRRPIEAEELTSYVGLVDLAEANGDSVEAGLELALSAMLVAPDFLYRVEPDPEPGAVRALNGYELASRLSYFLWASMPDDELLSRAADGSLTDQAQIAAEVTRMLADDKASAFFDVMVEQWLHTLSLDFAEPSVAFYPTWHDDLRDAMEGEVRAFTGPILAGAAPATDLLTANYSYVNRPLAEFYGLPGDEQLSPTEFSRVPLTDSVRGGVLRQGSFLVLTSHPDSHSPTRRGKWILDRLLCVRPPSPPANVPSFDPTATVDGTLRDKLTELHLADPGCAACHALIDPIGFALEHYDGVGLWRDTDNGLPVDASGTLPGSGVPFDGAAELSAAIAADERFPRCMAKQFLTYALGRTTGAEDEAVIAALGESFAEGGFDVPSLISAVATSNPMTLRQAEAE